LPGFEGKAMRQAVEYIRVSTGQQGKSGLGIEAQREAISRFANAEDCKVLSEVVEVEPARETMRWIAGRSWPRPW
jgi:DNA invertase Pin-like site-specific DNA recombinase